MGYSEMLFLLPQVGLIPAAVLLGVCFAVLFAGKSILKIEKQEITTKTGSFILLIFTEWGFNIAALYATFLIMFFISSNPFFEGIHSEYGIAQENAYVPAVIYLACMAILHIAFFSLSYIYFKKAIKDKQKGVKLFIPLVAISAIVWAGVLGLILGVY